MGIFSAKDIFEFAVQIEINGEKFYRTMAGKLGDEKIKGIFDKLADEELVHKKTFEKMASQIGDYKPSETYSGEYESYMTEYTDNIIFSNEHLDEDMAHINDIASALTFAMKNEMESILYYKEIINFVPESEHTMISGIIEEERRHFVKLSELKREM